MGNEYTVRCRHGNVVYRGPSRSQFEWYKRADTPGCSTCQSEDNAESQRRAQEEADRRRREEDERVERRRRELERLERERQIAREKERKRLRDIENARLEQERKDAEKKRKKKEKEIKEALRIKAEELEKEAERLKKLKWQSSDPFLQYKKLDTLNTIKEIGKQVNEVAVVGEIVKERVPEIAKDLEDTLGDDYKLVKGEMDRYEKYGKEMADMTNVFKTELNKAFKAINPNVASDSAKAQNEANDYQKLIDEESDDDTKEDMEDEKKSKQDEVKAKLKAVEDALKTIQYKLQIMQSYYDQMIQDYQYFVRFMNTKQDELDEVIAHFQDRAAQIEKDGDRDVLYVYEKSELYDKYKSEEQKTSISVEYEYKETHTSDTGVEMGDAIATGALLGAAGGGLVGVCCGGGPGLVGGAVVGCVVGAAAGAIYGLCNKPEYKVGYTTKTGTLTISRELTTYSGREHAEALKKIIKKVEDCPMYQDMKAELEEKKNLAKQQMKKLRDWKTNMLKVEQPLMEYDIKMNELRNRLKNGEEINEKKAGMIDKQLQKLSAKMKVFIETMDK